MNEIFSILKLLLPYIPSAIVTIIAIGMFLFKVFSREKELISRMDNYSKSLSELGKAIENLSKELKKENQELRKALNEIWKEHHNFKEEVYKEYMTKKEISKMEERILRAIDKIDENVTKYSVAFYNEILRRLEHDRKG